MNYKEFLFYLMACNIAPFYFKPKKCPFADNNKLCYPSIWNCKYHWNWNGFFSKESNYIHSCNKVDNRENL